jgi:hypothetical protein
VLSPDSDFFRFFMNSRGKETETGAAASPAAGPGAASAAKP